jgi:hypothetical protein
MMSPLHIWQETAAGGALELVMIVATTAAVVALHLWLLRLFKDTRPSGGLPMRADSDRVAALRSQRRATTDGVIARPAARQ